MNRRSVQVRAGFERVDGQFDQLEARLPRSELLQKLGNRHLDEQVFSCLLTRPQASRLLRDKLMETLDFRVTRVELCVMMK